MWTGTQLDSCYFRFFLHFVKKIFLRMILWAHEDIEHKERRTWRKQQENMRGYEIGDL